ncbi:MAG: cation:proton antiporter, partial [Eubacteriales bacterium]|nr:cation:proton antiporter [Eubacteriales bacterium]
DIWMAVFITVSVAVFAVTPRLTPWFVERYGGRIAQIEIKLFIFLLLALGGLALKANSEAVLPAYILGLSVAGYMMAHKDLLHRLRTIAFAFFTPFYFLKAGLHVSLSALAGGIVLIAILLSVKVGAKFVGVWPLAKLFRFNNRESMYTTLLMSTGLTFGTISALFGLSQNLITQEQYTILVTVVIGSAIVPTLIAQAFFRPIITRDRDSQELTEGEGRKRT